MVTLINGVIVIGGIFVLNGLIARIHGLDVLGEFLLIKRTLSASIGILLVGMNICLLYTSPSPRDKRQSRMPSSA